MNHGGQYDGSDDRESGEVLTGEKVGAGSAAQKKGWTRSDPPLRMEDVAIAKTLDPRGFGRSKSRIKSRIPNTPFLFSV